MTKLLDTVDASLQEIEAQLLEEFNRIRNTLSESRFESIDTGIRNSLSSVVDELKHILDHSGDKNNLELQTERHETLFARTAVIKQLLSAKIPTAYLHQIHKEVKSTRRKLETKVEAKRQQNARASIKSVTESSPTKGGFLGSLKGLFQGNQSKQETLRNRIKITDQEAKEFESVGIYLDNGIYSASRELAMLSSRMVDHQESANESDAGTDKKRAPAPSGKASFESRDLSQKAPDVKAGSKARSANDIRKKTQANTSSASVFESKDLSQTIAPTSRVAPVAENKGIAKSADAIREKLAARQQSHNIGKASFGSKDIDHAMPISKNEDPKPFSPSFSPSFSKQEPNRPPQPTLSGKASFGAKDIQHAMPLPDKKPTLAAKAPEPLAKGKAIFESKDLSNTGPIKKK